MSVRWKGEDAFYQRLIKLDSRLAESAGKAIESVGEAIVEDIQKHWGKEGAPEEVTGNLNSSVRVKERRGELGTFVKKGSNNILTAVIGADTRQGSVADKQKTFDYGAFLELYGKGKQYPFIEPAFRRAQSYGKSLIEREVKRSFRL